MSGSFGLYIEIKCSKSSHLHSSEKSGMPESDDQTDLMKKIRGKDQEALKELYDLYKRILFGMIFSIVKSREEAEDLLQEVFVTVWEKAPAFDENRGNVYSWIATLARNKSIDRIRSKGYKARQNESQDVSESEFLQEDNCVDPLEKTIFAERAEQVKQALKKIPKIQSEVLKIACYRGMTQTQISRHLDIPLGTVKSRMRQGMIHLKEILT